MYILYNKFLIKSIGRVLRACCRSHVPIYVIRFCKAAGHFNAAGPLLYTFLLDLILLYQKLNHKSICLARFKTDKLLREVNFALLDSFYLCYWTSFFSEERVSKTCFAQSKFVARWRPYGKINAARRSPNG